MVINIYIDGSAPRNPGREGGISATVEYPDEIGREPEEIFTVGYSHTTNNRMELMACITAIQWACDNVKLWKVTRVIIYTDSQYVVDNQKRVEQWRKDKWRNRYGKPVDNHDLWRQFLSKLQKACTMMRLEVHWHKGKSTPIVQDVDKHAKQAARSSVKRRDYGYRPGTVSRTKLPGLVATPFPANNQEAVIRVYRKDLKTIAGRIEFKIFFDVFLESNKCYVAKHFAYADRSFERDTDRSHHYRVRFNDNSNYPAIQEIIEEVLV